VNSLVARSGMDLRFGLPVLMAIALALPAGAPGRELITTMAVGGVLFTLVVQGLTLPLLVSRLGLAGRPAPE